MNQLDVYYRALRGLCEQTQQNKDCVSDSRTVGAANASQDKITLTRKHCIVEEDWVDAIEEGLKYVEKAIAEERQFIRSNGEVVPIEKVKSVSKDSVVHLARHSNLITRETPGEDVIPDQVFTVEKLNDYAVYENRFLYMLLCYLRDFITLRYNKILELSNTYNGTMTMNKVVKTAKRTLKYSVELEEERKNDTYLKANNRAKDIIERIDLLLKTVLAFLSRPLMEFVSKAPMLKPPITRTNVLKMNNNFKQAMNLYGFVISYKGDGYSVETEIKDISPFSDIIAGEMSETILLSSFITYEHSLGIEDELRAEFDEEEKRIKEREYKKFLEKLEAVRVKLSKMEVSPEEYIVMLEKNINILEKRVKDFDKLKRELEKTKELLEEANEENRRLKENLERTTEELEAWKQKYIDDMAAQKAYYEEAIATMREEHEKYVKELIESHEKEIADLKESHEREIADLKENHKNEIDALNESHRSEIDSLKESHKNEIDALNESHRSEMDSLKESHRNEIDTLLGAHRAEIQSINDAHDAELSELKVGYEERLRESADTIEGLNAKMKSDKELYDDSLARLKQEHEDEAEELKRKNRELEKRLEAEINEKRLINAQLLALKKESGKLGEGDSYITQLKFDELERTFETFKAFYKAEWSKAKRTIRREVLKKNGKNNSNGEDE